MYTVHIYVCACVCTCLLVSLKRTEKHFIQTLSQINPYMSLKM